MTHLINLTCLKGSRKAPLAFIASLASALVLSASSHATDNACLNLFANRPEALFKISTELDSQFNDASREFVMRLRYLLSERRLLSLETLTAISSWPEPMNPLGKRPPNLELFPHHAAFDTLLGEGLQWDLIRQAALELSGVTTEQKKREDKAIEETAITIHPILLKRFGYEVNRIVQTPQGKALAISAVSDVSSATATLTAHDLYTGEQVTQVLYHGLYVNQLATEQVNGETLNFTSYSRTGDAINKIELPSDPGPTKSVTVPLKIPDGVPTASDRGEMTYARFVEKNGSQVFVKYDSHGVYFFDASSGTFLNSVPVEGLNPRTLERISSFGSSLFITRNRGPSVLIDPWDSTPVRKIDQFSVNGGFTYQGQRYILGEDLQIAKNGLGVTLRTLNIETGQTSQAFQVNMSFQAPYLLQTFEQNGGFYGIIATDVDSYLVDLIKGEVIQTTSSVEWGQSLDLKWGPESVGQIGFRLNGKYYLIAILRDSSGSSKQLAILDAMTLIPVGLTYPVKGNPKTIVMAPGKDNELSIILNFQNRSSELISLLNPM